MILQSRRIEAKPSMKLTYAAKSDIGRIRLSNQDFALNKQIGAEEYLFSIADGMGGHRAGDVAARMGSQIFAEQYESFRGKEYPITDALKRALAKANREILDTARINENMMGMGTTLSVLVLSNYFAFIIHIGDTRVYLVRQNGISQLTRDHTFVEKLREDGNISAEEAKYHPRKNVLYQSLGAKADMESQLIQDLEIRSGDTLVLCSDGLTNLVDDKVLKNYVLDFPPLESVDGLVQLANQKGGTDNISVQVVKVSA